MTSTDSKRPVARARERHACPGALAAALLACLLAGCGGLPTDFERPRSFALDATEDTRLGRGLAPRVRTHGGASGVHPLGNGLDAFVARLALAGAADLTLDVQYYLFHDDATGRLLAGQLLQAADRGVRVRLLLDDMDMAGRDEALASLARHPEIEIRLFNPFPSRVMRQLDFLTHFGTVTRRMHNKSFTVDGQATIVGGRNVGDAYFEAAEGVNFGDMDVLAIGPIVREVSEAFDRYWNSDLAYPVEAFASGEDPALLQRSRLHLAEDFDALPGTPYGQRLRETQLADRLRSGELDFYWGPARLLYDLPEKISSDPEDRSTHLGPELGELFDAVADDLILVSPYFVPGEAGTALLRDLVARGCRVTVLTNSLAATDVPAVHAGYAPYRRALLKAGVEVYEMRPSRALDDAADRRPGESRASLHAKTLVFDRARILVGSMNLDPRSELLNTEMGILIESEALARSVARWRDRELEKIAWRVELEGGDGRLVWIGREDGRDTRRHGREPEAGLWARIQAAVLRWLPIEHQL